MKWYHYCMKFKKSSFYKVFFIIAVALFIFFAIEPDAQNVLPLNTNNTNSELTNNNKPFVIVAFGDSLTAGYGVSLDESYPSLLENKLKELNSNIQVINMGVSGEVTTAGIERVDFVLSQKPSLVLLGLGANDMLRASSPVKTRDNLEIIINRFKDANIPVILLGMKSVASNGEEYRALFDPIYPSLAQKYNLPLVPFFLEGVALNPALNTNDGIHPNKSGYEKIINDNILPVLLPILENNKVLK